MAVRCVSALQRWDTPEDSRYVSLRSREVMAVRCVRAGKSKQAPAAPTLVPRRSKLVMHVLSDNERASTLQADIMYVSVPDRYNFGMMNLVSDGSLALTRCSRSSGRDGSYISANVALSLHIRYCITMLLFAI